MSNLMTFYSQQDRTMQELSSFAVSKFEIPNFKIQKLETLKNWLKIIN